jgi:hypothetical protein
LPKQLGRAQPDRQAETAQQQDQHDARDQTFHIASSFCFCCIFFPNDYTAAAFPPQVDLRPSAV